MKGKTKMIYELRKYRSREDFEQESDSLYIAWETNKGTGTPCGKLINYLSEEEKIKIPEGIEIIGKNAFFNGDLEIFDPPVAEVVIPSSVKKIEAGAFAGTNIEKIRLAPGSTCGTVKNHTLFSGDGKTLLWILGVDDKPYVVEKADGEEKVNYIYIVPEGVEEIAGDFCSIDATIDVIEIPASVKKIGDPEYNNRFPVIRAPKGSNAIRIAKSRGWEYEEM